MKYIGAQIETLNAKVSQRETQKLPSFSSEQVLNFKPIFSFLNEKDRDILLLIFVSGKKQKDVQRILGRSQPSLCYDIKRIRKRLKFIFYLHSVFDIFLDFIQSQSKLFDTQELEILILMFYTSSFTMTADILGISQVKARYSFDKCLRKMEENEMWEVYEIFVIVRTNLNMVRRVYRQSGDLSEVAYEDFIPY